MVEVISECGLNHKGKLDIAKRMVEAACVADVDVVKFQTFIPEAIVHREDRHFNLLKELALSRPDFIELVKFCNSFEIEFLSTPGDVGSLKFLVEECGVKRIKIGSDDLTYEPLIEAAAETGLPLILSTGMANLSEISHIMDFLKGPVTLLHCVSLYPCPPELANLRAIETLRAFGPPVGYSDHVSGYWASIAAAAMGATIIEKHFMLKAHQDCVDAQVSINEVGLETMVVRIRQIELMLGKGLKQPSPEEAANIPIFRKEKVGLRKCMV